MNKSLRIFGLISLLCFSFYYTNKIATFMQRKDPIYESILLNKEDYEILSVNAIIKDNAIIPGLYGKMVNVEKSFHNMKNYGYFSLNELVFDEIKPEISLENHLDKKINKGNPKKQAIYLILEDETHIPLLEELGISYALLTTLNTSNTHLSYGIKINNDYENYEELEKKLKLKKENNRFCFVSNKQEEFCKKKKKIMIEETQSVNKSNFTNIYHNLSSGSILFIQNSLSSTNIKLLINQIYFKGYSILSLEDLVSETRS